MHFRPKPAPWEPQYSRAIRVTSEKSYNLKGFWGLPPHDLVFRRRGLGSFSLCLLIVAVAPSRNDCPPTYDPSANKVKSFSCFGQLNDTRCANGREIATVDTAGGEHRSPIGSWYRRSV